MNYFFQTNNLDPSTIQAIVSELELTSDGLTPFLMLTDYYQGYYYLIFQIFPSELELRPASVIPTEWKVVQSNSIQDAQIIFDSLEHTTTNIWLAKNLKVDANGITIFLHRHYMIPQV